MKIHIVGAGPAGMSLAWELLRAGDHEVTIYDRKLSAGGSWWNLTKLCETYMLTELYLIERL